MRFAVLILLLLCPVPAVACRLGLVVGLDISGSVDAEEYQLQRQGLAAALMNPDVRRAILAAPEHPVMLNVFEWSGPGDQSPLVPWSALRTQDDIAGAAGLIANTPRHLQSPETGIGAAIRHGAALLRQQPSCEQLTLDLTGDGESNAGPRPREVKRTLPLNDILINALVIGGGQDLSRYFKAEVIHGPGAFIEPATGFDDFEAAMVRKLLREVQGMTIAAQ